MAIEPTDDGAGLIVSQILAALEVATLIYDPLVNTVIQISNDVIELADEVETVNSPSEFTGTPVNLDGALNGPDKTVWWVYYVHRLTGEMFETLVVTEPTIEFPVEEFDAKINDKPTKIVKAPSTVKIPPPFIDMGAIGAFTSFNVVSYYRIPDDLNDLYLSMHTEEISVTNLDG